MRCRDWAWAPAWALEAWARIRWNRYLKHVNGHKQTKEVEAEHCCTFVNCRSLISCVCGMGSHPTNAGTLSYNNASNIPRHPSDVLAPKVQQSPRECWFPPHYPNGLRQIGAFLCWRKSHRSPPHQRQLEPYEWTGYYHARSLQFCHEWALCFEVLCPRGRDPQLPLAQKCCTDKDITISRR